MAKRQKKSFYGWRISVLALMMSFAIVVFVMQLLPEKTSNTAELSVTKQFIADIGPKAQLVAATNDLYASVMIAQAILESDSGQSTLSQPPHYNFFGIKGSYQGGFVSLETWEDDGQGNPYMITADFRSYGSIDRGLADYALFLQSDLYWKVHKSHTRSYRDATEALTGTYATDTSYGSKLNDLIQRYQLTRYD